MEAPLAKGTKVAQVVKPIEGLVTDIKFNADDLGFEYHVVFADADGTPTERWFKHSEIAEVK